MHPGVAGRQLPVDPEKMCDVSGWPVSNHAERPNTTEPLDTAGYLAASPIFTEKSAY
jgi:hypothetical protein